MPKKKEEKKYFRVAIFGSARIKRGDPRYKLVYTLAKMIASKGIDIVTGGGPGLMDAANNGHHAGRKKRAKEYPYSIGLLIKLPKEQKESPRLDEKERFLRFSKRLDRFMLMSNVVVVTPGGIGTSLEFLYTWQLMQVKHICNTPIVLLGEMWFDYVKWVKKWPLKKKLISPEDLNLIYLAKNPKEALDIIERAHEEWHKGGKKICLTHHKYLQN